MLYSSYAAKLSPLLDEYAAEGNVVPDEEIAGKIESIRMALGKGKVQVKDKDIHQSRAVEANRLFDSIINAPPPTVREWEEVQSIR